MVLTTNVQPSPSFPDSSQSKHDALNNNVLKAANEHIVNKNKEVLRLVDRNMAGAPVVEVTEYPTVDLSAWIKDGHTEEERESVLDEILKHSTDAGSFNISGHGVPIELIVQLEKASKNFFSMPLEEKKKYTKGNNRTGYVAVLEESNAAIYGENAATKDLREVYGAIYPPETDLNVMAPTAYQELINEFLHCMNRLDKLLHVLFTRILVKVKSVSLPDNFLESAKGGMLGVMRASHYPDVDSKYNSTNKLRAHSDFGTLAFLYSSVEGLEEVRDGKWIKVPIRPGELHVNVAEMLHIWSNGLFVNNIHRVSKAATGRDRLSLAYFSTTIINNNENDDGGVEPVCADNEKPMFARIGAKEHVENYLKLMF